MMTSDERLQIQNFQSDLHDLIDGYLREGMFPSDILAVLQEEAGSDIPARMRELEAENDEPCHGPQDTTCPSCGLGSK